MKKNILILLTLFLLSSCGIPFVGNDEEDEQAAAEAAAQKTTKDFTTADISVVIPTNWKEIGSDSLPVPKTGKITLAIRSDDTSDDIYRTMVILQDTIIGKLSSSQYARNDYRVSIKNYSGHREISEKDIEFADGVSSKLYTFEAKYNPDSPRMRFLQSSKICSEETKNNVYNVTIALPPSIEDLDKYEALIKSLSCIKKEED